MSPVILRFLVLKVACVVAEVIATPIRDGHKLNQEIIWINIRIFNPDPQTR
jgi:hypothetical protein